MKKSERLKDEIQEIKRHIEETCLEDLEYGTDGSNITRSLEARLKGVRAELKQAIEDEKPKPPAGYRPYTLQEAYDVFGFRSYTDVQIREAFERNYILTDDEVGIPVFEYQIDGIIISCGEIQVRMHRNMESDDYHYVTLDDLVIDYIWPGGLPCGVKV